MVRPVGPPATPLSSPCGISNPTSKVVVLALGVIGALGALLFVYRLCTFQSKPKSDPPPPAGPPSRQSSDGSNGQLSPLLLKRELRDRELSPEARAALRREQQRQAALAALASPPSSSGATEMAAAVRHESARTLIESFRDHLIRLKSNPRNDYLRQTVNDLAVQTFEIIAAQNRRGEQFRARPIHVMTPEEIAEGNRLIELYRDFCRAQNIQPRELAPVLPHAAPQRGGPPAPYLLPRRGADDAHEPVGDGHQRRVGPPAPALIPRRGADDAHEQVGGGQPPQQPRRELPLGDQRHLPRFARREDGHEPVGDDRSAQQPQAAAAPPGQAPLPPFPRRGAGVPPQEQEAAHPPRGDQARLPPLAGSGQEHEPVGKEGGVRRKP